MRDLLPDPVAVAVAGPTDWTGTLLPEEAACLSPRAVESRRRDYAAGRTCARRALAALGLAPMPVTSAPDRSPVWPSGVVGAITHTNGYCAAVAARSDEIRSVGIDAEQHQALDPGVRRMVCLPEELDWWAAQDDDISWPAVIFSAKETVYKIWHPIVRAWLGFHDARLEIHPDAPARSGPVDAAGTFVAHIVPAKVDEAAKQVADPPTVITGRFVVADGLVRTAAYLPAR
ncbi:4'-phosphopantetheinyl transferase family protein [Micromonospora echinofusca]|uniref:4'-phosphopantetheinyl transferase superfamily protein n=1 Tax=Micromonospora echinofusca TaxID=47858 RepID=A0ABS3VNB9_MICEH|nr:4'-phosphopantetheinyl transferase superfamily protein [Micromonospora echinofusca]MBO4205987.1 4'-phosphopantetheinyl transferase superfamily protein [Micromonospora echinofusca]